ncbi:DUF4249 domain-containing protein [Filimonas lacunae]|nr:DUF4249 domain-containing protein [Filimonas lacunae]BAV04402.1 hypothetical protein FLA_0391 [Filimonas lacunae]
MKNICRLSLVLLAASFLGSCERVIDINLNNASPKYVIEGVITNQEDVAPKVLISQTKNFSDDNNFPGITGATVTISDNGGAPVTLDDKGDGSYTTTAFYGTIGHTYALTVTIGSTTYTATSAMPPLVNMDSLYVSKETLFGDEKNIANVDFKDPAGKGNAYRWVQYVNGKKEKTIFVRDDDLTDGNDVNRKLFYFNDDDDDKSRDIKTGDNLRVDMMCIDMNVYKYWYSLDASATGENQQATPANPVSNIKGGALGYFSAHTYQTKTIIVP